MADDSGSGVLFTRDPSSGEKKILGELLFNAQGEDVVAGTRTPIGLDDLRKQMPKIHSELVDIVGKLESHYRDMQDVEFTIERGVLYMLQCRNAKSTARAAVKCAVDMVGRSSSTRRRRSSASSLSRVELLLHKTIDPKTGKKALCRGTSGKPRRLDGSSGLRA